MDQVPFNLDQGSTVSYTDRRAAAAGTCAVGGQPSGCKRFGSLCVFLRGRGEQPKLTMWFKGGGSVLAAER